MRAQEMYVEKGVLDWILENSADGIIEHPLNKVVNRSDVT